MADITISRDDVFDLLCQLDVTKSSGPDEVPARLLREGAAWLADPITRLYNLSLHQGCLPRDWTSAHITPVFKKGSKHLVSNYRPISLTCIVVKLLERLVYDHLAQFLTASNKLSPFQHGFRNRHSCQTQLLESVHEWARSLDRASSTHVILTDFSKAFDSVPHQRLLLKLEHRGVRGNLLAWISGFLANRRQRVLLDGSTSEWNEVTSGVPQGSVLGPLLFILYVNDIPTHLSSAVRLFADDCTIYRQVSTHQDCAALQEDLTRFARWCQRWQLPLNTGKCKAMCITLKKKPPSFTYSINNTSLEWVDTFRYLGVIINNKLKWGDHISAVTVKASRILNLLRRTMQGCRGDAKSRAYTALVRPILEYAAPVWAPHEQKHIDALEKVQRRAARWVSGARWDKQHNSWSTSYSDSCHNLQWLTLHQRRLFLCHCQTFKIIRGMDCIKFTDYFTPKSRLLRSHPYSLSIPQSRINAFRFSYFVNAPFTWNELPPNLIQSSSLSTFKFCLTKFLLNES